MTNNKKSRTYYAIKNVIFNFGYQIINTITNLIIPPLLISQYGSVINGLISTIKQIINYIQLVGAGISESSVVSLYKPLANKEHKKISAIYKASEITFRNAGMIFSIIAMLVAFIYPFFIVEELNHLTIFFIMVILSVSGATEFFAIGKYRALLTADQKIYIVNVAQAIGAILTTIATIIMIQLKCNIVMVQLVAMLAYILRILVLRFYFKKSYTYIEKDVEPNFLAVSKRKDATIHQIASLIIFGSQTILISKCCGLAEASVYSVYAMIFNGINTILSTVSSAMLAGIGNLMATDEKEKVERIYDIYEFLYYILVFICYITTYIMIKPFIAIYVGTNTDVNYMRVEIIVLFTVMGLLNCLRTPGATVINARGHYGETKNRSLIEMTICLVSEVILVQKLGLVGVLIGTIFAYLYRTLDVILYSNQKILDRKVSKTLVRIAINIFSMFMILFFITVDNNTINSFPKWMVGAIMIVMVTAIMIGIVNVVTNRKTVKNCKEYFVNLLGGRRKNV